MARIALHGYPPNVAQRGHDRPAIFAEKADYDRYLATLHEYKSECRTKALAWCMMLNHAHLLLAPEDCEALGKRMKRVPGRQTRHCNKRARRNGSLWESGYQSSVVQRDSYLRPCGLYIERNLLRAHVVAPESWKAAGRRHTNALALHG